MQHIKIFIASVFMLMAVTMSAAVGGTLIVTTLDGNKQAVDLTDKPIITMDDSELVIKLTDSELRYNIQQVVDFRYSDITNVDITEYKASSIQQNGDNLRFTAEKSDLNVRISNVAGIVLNSFKVEAGTTENISLGNLSSGLYLVTVNSVTYKIIKP